MLLHDVGHRRQKTLFDTRISKWMPFSGILPVYMTDALKPEAQSRKLTEISLREPIWGFDTGMAFRKSTAELAGIKLLNQLLRSESPKQPG